MLLKYFNGSLAFTGKRQQNRNNAKKSVVFISTQNKNDSSDFYSMDMQFFDNLHSEFVTWSSQLAIIDNPMAFFCIGIVLSYSSKSFILR